MDEMQIRLEAELAKLRASYLQRLPTDLAALADAVHKLSGIAERTLLEELHLRLHKLAGSGGTFGLMAMSERARHLENTARDWLEGDMVGMDEAVFKQWTADVKSLSDMDIHAVEGK